MMNRKAKVGEGYIKYHFTSLTEAETAKEELGKKFPDMKIKTTKHGSLFCHENGSMNFHLLILTVINKLGGVEAGA